MIPVRISLSCASVFMLLLAVNAQVHFGGKPIAASHRLTEAVADTVLLPEAMKDLRDEAVTGMHEPGEDHHAGFAVPLVFNPLNKGYWDVIDNQLHVWRIKLRSPGALAIGVNFSEFILGANARLFVYDESRKTVLGAFDHRNNNPNKVFSTAVIPGETIIIEYQEPYHARKKERVEHAILHIESIIHITQVALPGPSGKEKNIGGSGDCHVNINCAEGDNWQAQKRGVARMLMRSGNSYSWCTGSLINNTALDAAPLFLTASHCGMNASHHDLWFWQFYFNFELASCENSGFPPINMVYGADLLSTGPMHGGSDFKLLELHHPPPAHWRPYFNGWDRTGDGNTTGAAIHHPKGDVKKISSYTTGLISTAPLLAGQQMATNSAWSVLWDPTGNGHGVTEEGSSGSPIFNQNGKIIGTLSGGTSSCNNPNQPDFFGKFSHHWDRNGAEPFNRLDTHLDPLEKGIKSLPGLDPYTDTLPPPGYLDASLQYENKVLLRWYLPGTAPNTEGWYRYVDGYSDICMDGPERATVFDPPVIGLNYPVYLRKVAHTFFEHPSYPWSNDAFRFRVYDSDGERLLYESDKLTAQHQAEYVYTLGKTIPLDDYFYVAVVPAGSSQHPSSLMEKVNFGDGFSFYGTAGKWVPHIDMDNWTASTYRTGIYVSEKHEGDKRSFNDKKLNRQGSSPTAPDAFNAPVPETSRTVSVADLLPSDYRIYRNNLPVHTVPAGQGMTHTDLLPVHGFYCYQVTALYPGEHESVPSETRCLFYTPPCETAVADMPYTEVFESDFDDGCWLQYGKSDDGWTLTASHFSDAGILEAHAGTYFYLLSNNTRTEKDEWLITQPFDFSGLHTPALHFMFSGIFNNEPNISRLSLYVIDEDQTVNKVWDNLEHPLSEEDIIATEWHQATADLSVFAGQAGVRLAFRYQSRQQGFGAIDLVTISEADGFFRLTIEVIPDHGGTVSGAGKHLAGKAVRLKANPNIAHRFNAWMDGEALISHEKEFLYVMPGKNADLVAMFDELPTGVESLSPLKEDGIRVFPNPATGTFSLWFHQDHPNARVGLFNLQGRLYKHMVSDMASAGEIMDVHVGHLPRGLYFLKVQSDTSYTVVKILLSDQ